MKLVAFASLMFASSIAAADPAPTTHYVDTDVMIGAARPIAGLNAMLGVDAGVHWQDNVWLHGAIAAGPGGDDQGTGTNANAHGGLELRGCTTGGVACAEAGVDVGVQRGTWRSNYDMSAETASSIIAVPRAGFDVGGRRVRFHMGLEADVALAGTHEATGLPTTHEGGLAGVELATGIGVQW